MASLVRIENKVLIFNAVRMCIDQAGSPWHTVCWTSWGNIQLYVLTEMNLSVNFLQGRVFHEEKLHSAGEPLCLHKDSTKWTFLRFETLNHRPS